MVATVDQIESTIRNIRIEQAKKVLGINRYGDRTLYVDVLAEDVAVSTLKKHFPDFLLLSEEKGLLKIGNPTEGSPVFILDPIDGSTNYIRGIGYASISLAMAFYKTSLFLEDIVVGVVRQFFLDKVYSAVKGSGAWVNDIPAKPSKVEKIEEALIDIDIIRNIPPEERKKFYPLFEKLHDMRRLGSNALSLASVSDGTIDGAIDLRNKLRIFDCAAAQLIVKESGAEIEIPNYPINLDTRVNYVAASTKKLLNILLELIPEPIK